MIRLTFLILTLFFLSNCSISETSRIWNDKEEKVENQKNIKKLFAKEKKIITEFNPELKLDLPKAIEFGKVEKYKAWYIDTKKLLRAGPGAPLVRNIMDYSEGIGG